MKTKIEEINVTENLNFIHELLSNKKNLKIFIIIIFDICQKVKENTNNKIDSIFLRESKTKNYLNEYSKYLLIDYRILYISFLYFLLSINVNKENYEKAQNILNYDDNKELKSKIIGLFLLLLRNEKIAFAKVDRLSNKYHVKNDDVVINMDAISLKLDAIKELLSDDLDSYNKIEKVIGSNYDIYNGELRTCNSYSIDDYCKTNKIFSNEE